jgi:hypothetical protein
MSTQSHPLSNHRGGVVIITMVIISVMIVIFSSAVTFKLTELSRGSARVNEAYKYLNIMEEMGLIVARASELGKNGLVNCPGTTWGTTINTHNFCLPMNAGGTSMDQVCVEDQTQKNAAGANIKYCLKVGTGPTGGLDTAQNDSSLNGNVADITFDIVPVKQASYLEKAFYSALTMLDSSHAACSVYQSWATPCTPDNPNETASTAVSVTTYQAPTAFSTAPGGVGAGAPGALQPRNNMEPWSPTTLAWAPTTTNEIYTPKCDNDDQIWLGCMRCTDPNVLCIDMQMCPPTYTTGSACSQPYRQRIAVYTKPQGT